ncbi:MAG: DsrH/TusB family sulfur metabolism protein [Promethearchaeota archaeon]
MNTENSIVYLYGFSLWLKDKMESLLKILKKQIKSDLEINIVLIHDGVIGSTPNGKVPEFFLELSNLPVNIYAVIPDLKARGMDPSILFTEIKGIEYEDLVDILINTEKIVSWM